MKSDADQQRNKPSAADRQRLYRQRHNCGEMALTVRVGRKVVKALLATERLTDKEFRNRKKISAEVALVIEEWSSRWEEK